MLTSGPLPPNPAEIIASKSFARLIEELRDEFDLVIVDTPALLAVGDAAAIARCIDGLVFLVDLTRAKRPLLLEAAAQIFDVVPQAGSGGSRPTAKPALRARPLLLLLPGRLES